MIKTKQVDLSRSDWQEIEAAIFYKQGQIENGGMGGESHWKNGNKCSSYCEACENVRWVKHLHAIRKKIGDGAETAIKNGIAPVQEKAPAKKWDSKFKRKALLLLICALPFVGGCHSKLLDHSGDTAAAPQTVIGGPGMGVAPDFNLPTPPGFTRTVYYGAMPADGLVSIAPESGSTVFVFVKDAVTWFKLKPVYSDAFYYERPSDGVIQYRGAWLAGTEFCVYQYVPNN